MKGLNIIQHTDKNEYGIYRENNDGQPIFLKIPQQYPDPIYVSVKPKLPFVAQLFLGSLSFIGLYIVYKFIDQKKM